MYDVIIIGAGLSGISAGVRLSYYGRKVRILERQLYPGGLNSYYERGDRTVDVGLHALTNFVPEGVRNAPLNTFLRQMRIRRHELDLCPQTFSEIIFPQCSLRLDNDFAAFAAQVERLFPDEAAGFRRLCERIRQTDALSPTAPELSARAILNEYLSSSLLQDMLLCPVMLYGNPQAEDMDFNQFCIIFRSVIFEGFGRPRHGMKPFLDCLLKRFFDQGGELSLGVEVTRLIVRDGRIAAVVTDQGEELHADAVLSCAGALETARLCSIPPPELASFPAGPIGFCETMFELNRRPRELGLEACVIFRNCQERFQFSPPAKDVDLSCQIICMPGNYQQCDDIADANTVRVSVLASPARWLALPSGAVYDKAKSNVVNAQIALMEAWKPGFADAIVGWEMFTPKTIERFTGRVNGVIYGSPRKLRQGASDDLSNLFICGADQGFLGIVGALMSGAAIANRHLL
ncbi:MAG: NAD(P)/FAD-dependent oxidoreductase [Lentisphaerae bacterium]|nr:NAD(P)/FAD-dependent oxidoreductase [Lentisphaerota bacterium]OQC17841.1 MAG: Phytoene desaturase (lycopene-forming) [Lentisphaerae bacterium ADurb.Bin082]HQL88268.1 NAD(P)/FAD-dependent oxidoreductase [Lentisphaeria bacterium]